MGYNFQDGSGLQKVDSDGNEWSLICNEATITFEGFQNDFMTESTDGLNIITIAPTETSHLGYWSLTTI